MQRALRAVSLCVVVSACLASWRASADEFHYETFRFGDRALGMGGAVTAVPGQAESSYYNPAGLGKLDSAQISASFHFYGVDRRTVREGFFLAVDGDEQAGTQDIVINQDLVSDGFLPVPFSSVFSLKFGDHSVAYSTFLMTESRESFQGKVTLRGADYQGYSPTLVGTAAYGRVENNRTLLTGPTYAYSFSPDLHVGVSVFAARREYSRSNSVALNTKDGDTTTEDFAQSSQVDATDLSMLARVGILYQPTAWLSLGLSASSQSVSLSNSGKLLLTYSELDEGQIQNDIQQFSNLSAGTAYPWQFALGAAFTVPELVIIAADVTLNLPSSYQLLDLTDVMTDEEVNTLGTPINISKEMVINYRVGLDWIAWPSVPIRAGAYTNFSAASAPPEGTEASIPAALSPSVDLYGVTAGFGYSAGDTSFNGGVNFEFGSGQDTVYEDILDPDLGYYTVAREELRLIFFFAGDLEFLQDAKAMVEDAQRIHKNFQQIEEQLRNLDQLDDAAKRRLNESLDRMKDTAAPK